MHAQSHYRPGYHVIVWADNFDPSLATLITSFPELILGHRVAIASCDSGPFQVDEEDMAKGWAILGRLAISPRVQSISDLPTPGFDEWYVYESDVPREEHASFVNHHDFSPFDENSKQTENFWKQVERLQPLHVLGAGASTMFLVARDEAIHKKWLHT